MQTLLGGDNVLAAFLLRHEMGHPSIRACANFPRDTLDGLFTPPRSGRLAPRPSSPRAGARSLRWRIVMRWGVPLWRVRSRETTERWRSEFVRVVFPSSGLRGFVACVSWSKGGGRRRVVNPRANLARCSASGGERRRRHSCRRVSGLRRGCTG